MSFLFFFLFQGAPIYSRLSNPTTEAAEAIINSLERGAGSITFSSGMAAVTSVMLGFLRSGDHVVSETEYKVAERGSGNGKES